MYTPKSVWIVVDKYTIKTYLKKTFRKYLRFSELSLNCFKWFKVYFHERNDTEKR